MVEAWLECDGQEGSVVGLGDPSMTRAGFEALHLLLYPGFQACLPPAHPTVSLILQFSLLSTLCLAMVHWATGGERGPVMLWAPVASGEMSKSHHHRQGRQAAFHSVGAS